MPSAGVCLVALLIIRSAFAVPSVAFPINSQVPPVAQVAQPFEYQFASSTFSDSSVGALNYSIQGAPGWLSLQGNTRTFSGTPQGQDVGPFTFELSAADEAGSAGSQVTFFVDDSPQPSLSANVTGILAKAGALSDLTSLNLHPGAAFALSFSPDVYTGSNNLTYYATSADHSPLPSWITFDAGAVAFSGTTPPPVPNPQVVPLRLIASTIAGFADASFSFNLVISDHTLAFADLNVTTSVGVNDSLLSVSFQHQLLSDGMPIAASEIAAASIQGPAWVSLDEASLTLSGLPPQNAESSEVHLTASDIFGNTANAYVHLDMVSSGRQQNPARSTAITASSTSATAAFTTSSPTSAAEDGVRAAPRKSHAWIAAAVLAPIAAAALLTILLWWCCRRRRRRLRTVWTDEQGNMQEKHSQEERDGMKRGIERISEESLGSHNQLVLDGQGMSLGENEPAHHRSQRYPLSARRRSTLMKQRSSRISRLSQRSSSITDSRRLTGLGHGRLQSFGSPTRVDVAQALKARRRCTQCGSSDVETLGSSPPSTLLQRRPMSDVLKPSIRMIPTEESSAGIRGSENLMQELLKEVGEMDDRSFQDKRSSYLRKGRGWGAEYDKRTHDEQIYDLQRSYDRLKRELRAGSVRGQAKAGAGPSTPNAWPPRTPVRPSTRSTAQTEETGMPTVSQIPSQYSHIMPGSQESNGWTDTEDESSRSGDQGEHSHQASESILDSLCRSDSAGDKLSGTPATRATDIMARLRLASDEAEPADVAQAVAGEAGVTQEDGEAAFL